MNTNKPYVFISYAHRDSKKVFTIIEWLENSGYEIWYDNGIDPGTEWDTTIAERVKNSTIVLAFISRNYLNSDNCKDELNFARNKQIDRILIYLEDVQLPDAMEMRLSRHQAIHFYKYIDQKEFYEKLCASEKVASCKKINFEQCSLVSDEENTAFREKRLKHFKINQQRAEDCHSLIKELCQEKGIEYSEDGGKYIVYNGLKMKLVVYPQCEISDIAKIRLQINICGEDGIYFVCLGKRSEENYKKIEYLNKISKRHSLDSKKLAKWYLVEDFVLELFGEESLSRL